MEGSGSEGVRSGDIVTWPLGGDERVTIESKWIVKPRSPSSIGSCSVISRFAVDVAAFAFFSVSSTTTVLEAAACLAKAIGEVLVGPHLKAGLFSVRIYVLASQISSAEAAWKQVRRS